MPKKSSNFVKVVFADKAQVLCQLREYAEKLKRNRPEVETIGLFGSYATDTFGPSSDVDLLIILRESSQRFLDRIPHYLPDNLTVDCDVFPYTKMEIEKMQQEGSSWIHHILSHVVDL
jgi:predicted nucleotidyltransferase